MILDLSIPFENKFTFINYYRKMEARLYILPGFFEQIISRAAFFWLENILAMLICRYTFRWKALMH